MAANLVLGVQYSAGIIPVRSNFVTLKPKATTIACFAANSPNTASKFGALRVPATTLRKGKTTVVAQSGITDAPTLSSTATATTDATTIQFVNSTGSVLTYKAHKFWQGTQDPLSIPKSIASIADYTHQCDASGSVGGLLYFLDGLAYWVVAWRNTPGSLNNKVYTDIFSAYDNRVSDPDKFWSDIYQDLMLQSSTSSKNDPNLGYSANLNITTGNTPVVSASFSISS